MTILVGLGFLALMISGLAGYGSIAFDGRLELAARQSSIGLNAALGLALYLAFCGLLEWRNTASPALFAIMLVIGALAWSRRIAWARSSRWLALVKPNWVLLLPLAAGLALIVNSAEWRFYNADDVQGYLVYVERILQTGSTGADPFSYRRFEAGLGGGSYIYALGGVLGDTSRLRIVDIGGGLVLLASMMTADLHGRSSAVLAIALALLVCVVAFSPAANMTPEVLGLAMLYAVADVCKRLAECGRPMLRMILVGLVVFAATCLKTTLIIPAASFAAAAYAAALLRERRWSIVIEALGAALVALLLMAPWMIVSERLASTPLFPLLGAGRLSPLEAGSHPSLAEFTKSAGRISLLLLLPLWVAIGAARRKEWFLAIAIPLCVLLSVLAQAKYTYAGYRYGYSAAAALFLISLVAWLKWSPSRRESLVAALLALLLLGDLGLNTVLTPNYNLNTFSGGILYHLVFAPNAPKAGDPEVVRRIQDAVPPGETLLARIDRPYLLDFRRNRIFVMDWPGEIGPDADMPDAGDAVSWRGYLRRAGVDFVAYSYGDEAGLPASYLREQLEKTDSLFVHALFERALRTQRALTAISRSEPTVFDDGVTAVTRLRQSPIQSADHPRE